MRQAVTPLTETAEGCYPLPMETHFVYILRCGDGSLYTGWTCDLAARIKAHAQGRGAKYTKSHLPIALVYYETFAEKGAALSREIAIKKMVKDKKETLIRGFRVPKKYRGE